MLALLLCLSPTLQGSGHAALHATDSELFFEVPSIGSSGAAVARSPVMRAVRAPEFQAAIAPFIDLGGANPVFVLESLLGTTGLDQGQRDALTQCFVGLTAVSVSLRGAQSGAVETLHEKRRVLETLEELQRLEKLLGGGWGRDLPPDLTALDGVTDSLFADAWGNDYIYEPGHGRHYTLLSYGRDGEPGGWYADADLAPRTQPEEAQVRAGLEGLGGLIVLEFDEPALAEQAAYLSNEGLVTAGIEVQQHSLPNKQGAGTYTTYLEQEVPELGAWFFHRGDRVVYGFGTEVATLVAARFDSGDAGLQAADAYRKTMGRLDESKGQLLYQGYSTLDPAGYIFGLSGRIAPLQPENPFSDSDFLMEMYSVRQPSAWRTVFDGRRYVTTNFRADADLRFLGLPKFEARELEADAGVQVPKDAVFVFATTVDGEAVAETFRAGLTAAIGDAGEAVLETGIAILGFDPTEDLLGNLSGELLVYSKPMRGITAPPVSVLVGLEDEESFREGLMILAELAEEQLPDFVRAREQEYRGVEMLSFQIGDSGSNEGMFNPIKSVAPCLAVVEGKLLITLSSLHAKREIKRLQRLDRDEPVHPLFTESGGLGPGVVAAWYVDWGAVIEGIDSTVRALGVTMSAFGPDEFPEINWSKIPDIQLITSYLQPSRGSVRRVDGGLLTSEVNSIGPETWFGGPALVFSTAMKYQARREMATWHRSAVAVDVTLTPKDENEAYTLDALGQVIDALDRYHTEHRCFPEDLETLLDGSKRYPNGYLKESHFLNDAWGEPLIYTTTRDGRDFELRSCGPDGEDASGRRDDIKVR